jgi:hypothetical protein
MHKSASAMKWGLRVHIFWYVVANLAQVVVWWLATPDQFFWPLWSVLAWGIGLVAHIWAVRSALKAPAGL